MKKLLVLAFVVSSALAACGKSKPAATTPPAGDQKMEGETKPEETKPAEGEAPADPCAGTTADPCAAAPK